MLMAAGEPFVFGNGDHHWFASSIIKGLQSRAPALERGGLLLDAVRRLTFTCLVADCLAIMFLCQSKLG